MTKIRMSYYKVIPKGTKVFVIVAVRKKDQVIEEALKFIPKELTGKGLLVERSNRRDYMRLLFSSYGVVPDVLKNRIRRSIRGEAP